MKRKIVLSAIVLATALLISGYVYAQAGLTIPIPTQYQISTEQTFSVESFSWNDYNGSKNIYGEVTVTVKNTGSSEVSGGEVFVVLNNDSTDILEVSKSFETLTAGTSVDVTISLSESDWSGYTLDDVTGGSVTVV